VKDPQVGEVNLKLFPGLGMRLKWVWELFLSLFVRRPGLSRFTLDAQRPWPPLSISWQPFPALFCWKGRTLFAATAVQSWVKIFVTESLK